VNAAGLKKGHWKFSVEHEPLLENRFHVVRVMLSHLEGNDMTIKVGDKIPESKFRVMTGDGPVWKSTDEVFKGKKVALFAVPGAYTGTCHEGRRCHRRHLGQRCVRHAGLEARHRPEGPG
jgi:hypothetical protein